ncbi:conjugative transfer protein MobI(A/C) [Pseudomonas sp. LS-2]|uniref:conjugative transfer protein MobI(A/C) n=1 Tax=Pseudomonas sp. LS-2 TaxID=2315859 RepID=UPI000E72FB0D|nr:conjugative transfer protein MobI(A/C) [Pseudomonas sp. LS-2]RJX72677.1 hypothetical protein D3M70_31250 [Pseudomonas sp. LS-2]
MIEPINGVALRGELSARYLPMILECDAIHEQLKAEAIRLKDQFIQDARDEGKLLYRSVQVKTNREGSVSIVWTRIIFSDKPGGGKRQRQEVIKKGRDSHTYNPNAVIRKADYWLQQLFHQYEPKFAILRESLVMNMKARKQLLEIQRRVNANPPV